MDSGRCGNKCIEGKLWACTGICPGGWELPLGPEIPLETDFIKFLDSLDFKVTQRLGFTLPTYLYFSVALCINIAKVQHASFFSLSLKWVIGKILLDFFVRSCTYWCAVWGGGRSLRCPSPLLYASEGDRNQ